MLTTIPSHDDPRTYKIIGAALEVHRGPADHAQVIGYLASSKLHVALLLNFGGDRLEHKRFVRSPVY